MNTPKDNGYRTIDFYLTKSCNKSCYYCTAWTYEMRNLIVDMDFLEPLLLWLSPYKVKINLLGGEPALVKNLKEVIDAIQQYENLIPSVLSNSLIRKKYPWVLEDPSIFYEEHLVLDFHEDRIEKLGNFDFFGPNDNNNYNIIIRTPNFYKYGKRFDISHLDHKNTKFKAYNSRSPEYNVIEQAPELDRRICAAFPLVPVIDFEIQKIRHCSKKVINGSRQFDILEENINKMMNYQLFEFEEYCRTCTEVISPRSEEQILMIMSEGNV